MTAQIGNTMKHLRSALSGRNYSSVKTKALEISWVQNQSAFVVHLVHSIEWISFPSFSFQTEPVIGAANSKHEIHVTARQEYPAAELLPLPINIDPTELQRFSPQRARDITSTAIATNIWNRVDITVDTSNDRSDPYVDSYDCTGAVSLNSSMQSNVPSPLGGMHKFTHLNMPGGQWEQSSKWMAHDLNASHYTNLRREARKNWTSSQANNTNDKGKMPIFASNANAGFALQMQRRFCSFPLFDRMNATTNHTLNVTKRNYADKVTNSSEATDAKGPNANTTATTPPPTFESPTALSAKDKLKQAVKDYGITVVIFHVTISLASLGFFYQVVAR